MGTAYLVMEAVFPKHSDTPTAILQGEEGQRVEYHGEEETQVIGLKVV